MSTGEKPGAPRDSAVRGDLGPYTSIGASSVDEAAWRSIAELEHYAHAAATFAAVWDRPGMRYALRKARAHAANALSLLELADAAKAKR